MQSALGARLASPKLQTPTSVRATGILREALDRFPETC
jgi:hypothetical protein